MARKKYKKSTDTNPKNKFAGGSITDEVRKATGVGGETGEEKSARYMKSQGRDPKATGKEYEDQLRASKGLGPNVERGPIIKDPEGNILGDEMTIGEEQETRLSRLNVLDFVSAPLSKPGTTLTQGLRAGAEAVKESRAKITEGDFGEAANVIGTTATTTGLLVGALLAGAGGIATAKALTAKLAATTGMQAAMAGVAATKAGLVGGAGLGIIYGIDKFVFSPNELGTWAAVDNVAGALSFQISELDNGVRDGTVDRERAKIIIEETKSTIENMRVYVNRQVEKNPKLWASSKIFNEALDTAEGRVLQVELQIFG